MTTIIQEGVMRWFGHIRQINEERSTRKVYEVRPRRRKNKTRARKTSIGELSGKKSEMRW